MKSGGRTDNAERTTQDSLRKKHEIGQSPPAHPQRHNLQLTVPYCALLGGAGTRRYKYEYEYEPLVRLPYRISVQYEYQSCTCTTKSTKYELYEYQVVRGQYCTGTKSVPDMHGSLYDNIQDMPNTVLSRDPVRSPSDFGCRLGQSSTVGDINGACFGAGEYDSWKISQVLCTWSIERPTVYTAGLHIDVVAVLYCIYIVFNV